MLSDTDRRTLLKVARNSIEHGLATGQALSIAVPDFPPALQERRSSFVTLHRSEQLRGCIGSIEAHRPLVHDVADNAFNAAFRDPRFVPLHQDEMPDLRIQISVLSVPEPMSLSSQADLLRRLRPGVDGLILAEGKRRGTFLPSVWESLPDPEDFLRHLKQKAGLPPDYWSDRIRVERYTTKSFSE